MTTLPKVGDRIKLIKLAPNSNGVDDPSWNKWRHKGDLGTVTSINQGLDCLQIWVNFDDGGHLGLLFGIDSFEVLS